MNTEQLTIKVKHTSTVRDKLVALLEHGYNGEMKFQTLLPELIDATRETRLKGTLSLILDRRRAQVARLESVFTLLGINPRAVKCMKTDAVLSAIDRLELEMLAPQIRRELTLAAAVTLETHLYERYKGASQFAELCGIKGIAETVEEITKAEKKTHQMLTLLYPTD